MQYMRRLEVHLHLPVHYNHVNMGLFGEKRIFDIPRCTRTHEVDIYEGIRVLKCSNNRKYIMMYACLPFVFDAVRSINRMCR